VATTIVEYAKNAARYVDFLLRPVHNYYYNYIRKAEAHCDPDVAKNYKEHHPSTLSPVRSRQTGIQYFWETRVG